jgi:hypothetical protein
LRGDAGVEEVASGKTKIRRLAAKDFPLSGASKRGLSAGAVYRPYAV